MKRFGVVLLFFLASNAVSAAPDYHAAIEQQKHLVDEQPTAATWNDLGALLLLVDQQQDARSAFETALELDPDNVIALYNAGVLALDRDPYRALRLLNSALKQGGADAWTHYRLGEAFERLARERKAVSHYARAFELRPSLLFVDVNPAIVENQLATKALLRTRYVSDQAPEPRFADPLRVREFLVEVPEEQAAKPSLDSTRTTPQPVVQAAPSAATDDSPSTAAPAAENVATPAAENTESNQQTLEQQRQERASNLPPPDDS